MARHWTASSPALLISTYAILLRRCSRIRPQDFIHGPYVTCPKCGTADAFGVLMINSHSYRRRCKKCLFAQAYDLPRLAKKLIYLDQFAISDMMKAINPNARANREGKVDAFWGQLFTRLDRLRGSSWSHVPSRSFMIKNRPSHRFGTPFK